MTVLITGVIELNAKFNKLKRGRKMTAMRAGVSAAARIQRKEVKRQAPVRTGTLKRSLTTKTKSYSKSHTVMGIIGVKKGTAGRGGKFGRGARTAIRYVNGRAGLRVEAIRPEKYLHLVAMGTKYARANEFLSRAHKTSKDTAENAFTGKFRTAILREARKA